MCHFRENLSRKHGDVQLFPALTHKCLTSGLAGFDLSADELPQKASRLVRRPAADQEAPLPADQRGNDLGHAFSPCSFLRPIFANAGKV